jgi:hypothetical protein
VVPSSSEKARCSCGSDGGRRYSSAGLQIAYRGRGRRSRHLGVASPASCAPTLPVVHDQRRADCHRHVTDMARRQPPHLPDPGEARQDSRCGPRAEVLPGVPRTVRLGPGRPSLLRDVLRVLQPRPPPQRHRPAHPRLGALRHRRRDPTATPADRCRRLRRHPRPLPRPTPASTQAAHRGLDQPAHPRSAHTERLTTKCLNLLDKFRCPFGGCPPRASCNPRVRDRGEAPELEGLRHRWWSFVVVREVITDVSAMAKNARSRAASRPLASAGM